MEKTLRATHPGILNINGIKIQCYVLEDGRRILSQRGTINALGMSHGSSKKAGGGGARLSAFVGGEWLKPFLSNDLVPLLTNPYEFFTDKGAKALAYDATILVDICDAIVQAKNQGHLTEFQKKISQRSEILIRGFAKVGIIALVDEATGYQEVRDRLALQKILDKYLLEEYQKVWTRRFPNEFYEEMFRLKNWQWNAMSVKRPSVVGTYTNDIVYKRLAPQVLEEIKKRNKKIEDEGGTKVHQHRWLTLDTGIPALDRHLHAVIALMRAAPNWSAFYRSIKRAFPMGGEQEEIRID
jgi:hypothetical protein